MMSRVYCPLLVSSDVRNHTVSFVRQHWHSLFARTVEQIKDYEKTLRKP